MSVVNSSTFSNKKPNLTGTVTSDLIITQNFPAPIPGFSCSGGQLVFTTIGSTSATVSFTPNELFIKGQASFRLSSSNAMQVRLIRDGNEGDILNSLTTAITTSGTWILSTTIFNETVGAHSYQWQILNTNNPGETSCVENTAFYNILSEANDSHNSKNTNIIRG